MNNKTIETLQYHDVKREVASFAISEIGKQEILNLVPSKNTKQIEAWLEEVTEAKENFGN